MAKIYYKRIKAKLMSINDVPLKWREEVVVMLKESGDIR